MRLLTLSLYALPVLAKAIHRSGASHTICHDHVCYPSVFVATDTYQEIHDDQEVPGGLHYRINLETGRKEAKLLQDAQTPAPVSNKAHAHGHPLLGALALVPGEEVHDERVPPLERKKKPFRPNRAAMTGGALQQFNEAQAALAADSTCSSAVQTALDTLEELAHELAFGLRVAESDVLPHLMALLGSDQAVCRGKSALVLGSALRNNANAQEVLPVHDSVTELILKCLTIETDAFALRMLVYALSATLTPDGPAMHTFNTRNGHKTLTAVFESASPALQGKVAALVEDHFVLVEPREPGLAMQKGTAPRYASKAKEEAQLGAWCLAFQTALLAPDMTVTDAREKLLSAVSGIKRHHPEVCQASKEFIKFLADESVGKTQRQGSPSLSALARSARSLFGHRLSARKLNADNH